MPTILQIDSSANASSHGKIAEAIGRLAMSQGWRSVMAYGRRMNPSQSELIHIGTSFDLKEHGLESRLLDNHGLASRRATKEFLHKVDEIKPDIIQLHNIHGYYLNYKLLFEYLNSTNIPVVWTLHDCWSFTGHCAHFVTAGCEKWKSGCTSCPLSRDYPKSYIDRSKRNYELKKSLFVAKDNLHVVTVSDWLAGIVKESYFGNKDIRVIKNGVNLDVFKPMNNYRSKDCFYILGVASVWTDDKGFADYYRLSELLSGDEFIVLVGVSEKIKKSLPHNIIGVSRTESIEGLVAWYNKADVVLSMSKAETYGITIAEALACGTPVIVYDNTAQPELLSGDVGYIVENGDVQMLYNRIQIIKTNGKDSYTKQCRFHAEREFDINRKYAEYLQLYNSIIQR